MTDTPTNSLEWVWFIAQKYSDLFIRGTLLTLAVSVTGTIAGFLLGYIVGIVQDTKINKEDYFIKRAMLRFFKVLSAVYVELFRGTPMIVQAMIVFYGLRQAGLEIDPISAGILVTLLNTGAYMAETVRGGINSIDAGQFSVMLGIVLPQAFRNIIPEMANTFLTNLKMTSVLNVIGVQELFLQAKTAGGTYYKYLESYLVIALIYLVLCFVFSRVFALIEKKLAARKDYVLAVEYMENTQ